MTEAATPMSRERRVLVMMTTMLAASIYSLNLTIVSISLPHMQGTFSATPDQISWVVTAFIVGMTTMIVATGWISRRVGRKRLFACSLAVFTGASLMCGNVTTLEGEVLWRFLQGVAGAPIIPLSQAISVDAYPPEQQGRAIGVWGIGNMLGPIIAPPLGGMVTDLYGWPAVFYINLPLGALALLGAVAVVPATSVDRSRGFDILGFALLAAGLISVQLVLNRGTRLDWFESPEILAEAIAGGFLLYFFGVRMFTARQPLLRPDMFAERNYSGALVVAFCFGLLVFLPTILLPLLLKNLRGYPVEMIGLLLAPRAAGVLIGNLLAAPLIGRLDYRLQTAFGFAVMGLSAWFMSRWTLDVGPWDVAWTGFVQGVGSSFSFVALAARGLSNLPLRHKEEALPVFYLCLNIGGSLGIAGTFTFWTESTQQNHAHLAESVTPYNPLFRSGAAPEMWNLSTGLSVAAIESEIMRQASMIAYNDSFALIAAVALAVAPLAFLMHGEKRLRRIARA